MHARVHACAHSCAQARRHACRCIHAHVHVCTRAILYMHVHAYTQIYGRVRFFVLRMAVSVCGGNCLSAHRHAFKTEQAPHAQRRGRACQTCNQSARNCTLPNNTPCSECARGSQLRPGIAGIGTLPTPNARHPPKRQRATLLNVCPLKYEMGPCPPTVWLHGPHPTQRMAPPHTAMAQVNGIVRAILAHNVEPTHHAQSRLPPMGTTNGVAATRVERGTRQGAPSPKGPTYREPNLSAAVELDMVG